ncbi:nucleotidyltransferase domain-containing protein [Rothia koreensis]|uniref:nucleotidyltransferase domain-containing protein n=1 Tax=Rothia koreensis TaxID=592378 RepID=UPI003F217C83
MDIDSILDKISEALRNVPGIQAIVLGGSRARGTHSFDSDIDVGIYYDAAALDIPKLKTVAHDIDDDHRDELVAVPGEWGDWVNGGGWLVVDGHHVDLILRETARVAAEIDNCQTGRVTAHYQTGHPHAYLNVMYVGELAVSRLLWDGTGEVSQLKHVADIYPSALKSALAGFSMFEARFSARFAAANATKDDPYYVQAHLTRSVSCLNQVLFALNEQYCINEKKAVRMIDGFRIRPVNYGERIGQVFREAGDDLPSACGLLEDLIRDTQALVDA